MTRVAFFPDSFLEVNGVAHTGRQLVEYASRRQVPLLCVHAGAKTIAVSEGTIRRLELPRGPFSFGLDKDLIFDLSYLRHFSRAVQECRDFVPDVIHITGPNDNGILGALVAHRLQIPLVASWHTNLHEYSGRRTEDLVKFLPQKWKAALSRAAERYSLEACLRYYRLGRVLYAPNPELCSLLEKRCERPCLLMPRGVDPELFSSKRRARAEGPVRIGYVGRLSPRAGESPFAGGTHGFRVLHRRTGSRRAMVARTHATCSIPRGAAGDGFGAGICRYGYIRVSFLYRYFRQRGA